METIPAKTRLAQQWRAARSKTSLCLLFVISFVGFLPTSTAYGQMSTGGAATYSDVWADPVPEDNFTVGYIWGCGVTEHDYNASPHTYTVNVTVTSPLGRVADGSADNYTYARADVYLTVDLENPEEGDYWVSTEHWYYCSSAVQSFLATTTSVRAPIRRWHQSYTYAGRENPDGTGRYVYNASCISSCTSAIYNKYYYADRGGIITCRGIILFGICSARCSTSANPNDCLG